MKKVVHKAAEAAGEDSTMSKFFTRKWIKVIDLLDNEYSACKNIRFKTPMLRLDFCDYSDAFVVVKGHISVKDKTNNSMLAFYFLLRCYYY